MEILRDMGIEVGRRLPLTIGVCVIALSVLGWFAYKSWTENEKTYAWIAIAALVAVAVVTPTSFAEARGSCVRLGESYRLQDRSEYTATGCQYIVSCLPKVSGKWECQ